MLGKLLCRFGAHRFRDMWRGPHNGWQQDVRWKCTRCGKDEKITLVSPLSGPRTGPMHSEAPK